MDQSIPYAEVVPEPAPAPRRYTLRLLAAYYALSACWGVVGVSREELPWVELGLNAALALALGWWGLVDARPRRHPVPLSSRAWFVLFAPLVVPVYVIWSRGWRGALWLVLHTLLGYGVAVATLYALWLARYGPWW